MGQRVVWVDAFADRPLAGNPAAVCVSRSPRGEGWMGAVARELGLSETAFVRPREGGFDLRWFTPAVEVDLCGHATLAAAHVLWEEAWLEPARPARFRTRSGPLAAERRDDGIAMDFPATPAVRSDPPPGMVDALGARPRWTGRTEQGDWLVELEDETTVRALAPDFRRLAEVTTRGAIATARADGEHDFVSRFFAPAAGIDEDPVTGSAHCALGPFWSERLGRAALVGFQASSRGGTVRVETRGERVVLEGRAVTVLRGELEIEEVDDG